MVRNVALSMITCSGSSMGHYCLPTYSSGCWRCLGLTFSYFSSAVSQTFSVYGLCFHQISIHITHALCCSKHIPGLAIQILPFHPKIKYYFILSIKHIERFLVFRHSILSEISFDLHRVSLEFK